MDELIYKLSGLLAEAFWRFLRPRRVVVYELPQDGGPVVRVTVEIVAEESIEIASDVYYQVVS